MSRAFRLGYRLGVVMGRLVNTVSVPLQGHRATASRGDAELG